MLLGSPCVPQVPLQLRLLAARWALSALSGGFTLLLGCDNVSSCQSPLHRSFAGQRKAPGRNHHLLSCESRSVGCNPSLPGRKNSEWPYEEGFPTRKCSTSRSCQSWAGKFLAPIICKNTWTGHCAPGSHHCGLVMPVLRSRAERLKSGTSG